MAVSKLHHSERAIVAADTSARKSRYPGQKKSDMNLTKMQAIVTVQRVFVERKIVKYRLEVDSPGYEVVQLYQSDKI
jgi:hypothetical protein